MVDESDDGKAFDFDFEAARRAWQERDRRRREEERARREQALLKARLVATHLRARYGVKRVFLYGSLAWERYFSPHSDIDLLVEGFPKDGDFWRMLAEVSEIAMPFIPSVEVSRGGEVASGRPGSFHREHASGRCPANVRRYHLHWSVTENLLKGVYWDRCRRARRC